MYVFRPDRVEFRHDQVQANGLRTGKDLYQNFVEVSPTGRLCAEAGD